MSIILGRPMRKHERFQGSLRDRRHYSGDRSSHAVAGAYKAAEDLKAKGYEHPVMIINISGRGDKDMNTAGKWFGYLTDEQAKALEANGAQGNNADGE